MKRKLETLKKNEDFKKLLSGGKRYSDKYLRAVVEKSETGKMRIGVAVKKNFGTAVARNRVRRQIKEAFRVGASSGAGRAGADIVVFPGIEAKNAGFLEIKRAINRILSRAGLGGDK
ncbi:ribonuclease P protein component [Candidatus Margulisiibacteriota bacterium]